MCKVNTSFYHGFKIYIGQNKIDQNDSAMKNVMELSKIYNKQEAYFVSGQLILLIQSLFKITSERHKCYRDNTQE